MWSSVIYTLESGDDLLLPTLSVSLSNFSLINGVLNRKNYNSNENVNQFVIPTSLINMVLLPQSTILLRLVTLDVKFFF